MSRKKELQPWDRRPWPSCADVCQETDDAAVGRAPSKCSQRFGLFSEVSLHPLSRSARTKSI